jgi:lactoylglutathione lyase
MPAERPAPARDAIRVVHVALYVRDVDRTCAFYEAHFGATAGPVYRSARTAGFTSRFLTFPGGGPRLEVMHLPPLDAPRAGIGYAHLALGVGDRSDVDALVARLDAAGVSIASAPRQTGDGYYEAVVLDPDGNPVEITTSVSTPDEAIRS